MSPADQTDASHSSPVVVSWKKHGQTATPRTGLYIGRQIPWQGLSRSCWANPFKAPRDGTLAEVLAKYELYVRSRPELLERLPELAGMDLACWCVPAPCHGDVLVRLFNELVRAPAS